MDTGYQVPRQNQNQHVETAYRWAASGAILRRTIDRSTTGGAPSYSVARLSGAEVEHLAAWHPGGDTAPDVPDDRWESITAARAAKLAEEP